MNKSEFLEYLEKRLSVLNNKEKDDIIQEYSQHIDLKVKSGLSEYEAIKDFGEIKDLADEILEAYNINPDFEENISNEGGAFNKFSKKIRSLAEFIFSQSPSVLLRMTGKILIVFAVFFLIAMFGFLILYNVLDELVNNYIPNSICALIISSYSLIAAAVILYMMYVYIKKLAFNIKNSTVNEKSFFTILSECANCFADFILNRKPTELIFMLFKIFAMGSALLLLGLIGMLVPTVINAIISNVIDIADLIYLIYLIIALPTGLYILFCYTARLAKNMSAADKEKKTSTNDVSGHKINDASVNNTEKSNVKADKNKTIIQGGQVNGDNFLEPVIKFFRLILHFSWRAVIIMVKISIICLLLMYLCILLPAVIFTGLSLVFMILGYPAIGIFLISLGFCISSVALIIFIVGKIFNKKPIKESEVV